MVSVALFGLPVIAHLNRFHIGFFSDPAMMIWYMAWWPHAIGHRLNPFITKAVWAPAGYNLTWATSMPALAIAFAPVTIAFGPVVSYNIASLLAPAISGWTAFLLCRHLTRNSGGAFAGGLIYGFSPYEAAHVIGGHPVLTFNFVPPLCVLLVVMLVKAEIASRRFILAFALALAIQCLISTEVLATMTLFGATAFVAAVVLMPQSRRDLIAACGPIALAYAGAAIILLPFLYYAFAKGGAPKDPIFPAALFSADLLSFIVPGRFMLVQQFGAAAVAARFTGNLWENGSYLSIPLLAVAGLWLWRRRRRAEARLLALVLLVVLVAALGPVLQVERRRIMILPWALAGRIPLIQHALPVRFANYAFLILAIIFSNWLSEPGFTFKKALAGGTLVALFPAPTLFLPKSTYDTPAFFADGLYRNYLQRDENVLIIPFGRSGPSMAWQAQSGMYFRMTGGHLSTMPEEFRRWPIVNALVTAIPLPDPAAQLKAFAAAHQVDAIVVADSARQAARELPMALGIRPLKIGGVSLYRLSRNPAAAPGVAEIEGFQKAAAQEWFLGMLCAAQRFIDGGGDLASLNPRKAYNLGLLPDSDWGDDLDFVVAGLPHGAYNGLWAGPGTGGTIAVGVPAGGAAARALVSRYGADAAGILYPYPSSYSAGAPFDDSIHFLLMTLRRSALRHCQSVSPKWWSSTAIR